MRNELVAAGVVIALIVILSTSSTHLSSAQSNTALSLTISIPLGASIQANQHFSINPANVVQGTMVTWINSDQTVHTITSGLSIGDPMLGKSLNSSFLAPGHQYNYTFSTIGSFHYLCQVHPFMRGVVNVLPPDNGTSTVEWKTAYTVGQFNSTGLPDQIFKVYYRIINGTIDSFSSTPLRAAAKVTSTSPSGGLLQVKYPRNYPYNNNPEPQTAGADSFLAYDTPGGYELQLESINTTTDCFFVISIPFSGELNIRVVHTFIPESYTFHGDNVPASCSQETKASNVMNKKDGSITPLQQFAAGVAAKDTVCYNGLELIIQPGSGKPYCAFHETKLLLINRWHIQS